MAINEGEHNRVSYLNVRSLKFSAVVNNVIWPDQDGQYKRQGNSIYNQKYSCSSEYHKGMVEVILNLGTRQR
jgi:hypothetical protein